MRPRAGLTITHLLIIVVIIVVAAAVLWPVFVPHGQPSRQSLCISNMKQIGLAIMQYARDYDETYPFINEKKCLAAAGEWKSHWSYMLQPYVKSPRRFDCPSQKNDSSELTGGVSHDYVAALFADGQSNIWLFGGRSSTGQQSSEPARVAQVKAPESVIAVYESGSPEIQGRCRGYFTQSTMGDDEAVPMPHSDGGTFCFGDGHVKWYRTAGLVWSGPGPGAGKYYDISAYKISVRRDYKP